MNWLAQRFELARGGAGGNVRTMEGMRGFAVLLVFCVHYADGIGPWIGAEGALAGLAGAIGTIGNAGVDLFFVLSGYLIYGSLIDRPQPFMAFLRRRAVRIYPAFLAVFALYICLSIALPSQSKIPPTAAAAAAYLVGNLLLLPGLLPIQPMITVAWSLSYEAFYYLSLPALIGAFALRAQRRSWRVGFFLVLGASIAIVCAAFGGPVRLIMFIAGVLVHEAMRGRSGATPSAAVAAAALALGLLATLLPLPGPGGDATRAVALFITLYVLCFACFREPRSWLARAFAWTPLRWLGNMSYSYYLLHGVMLKGGFLVAAFVLPAGAHGAWVFWLLLPAMLLLTLIGSAALFLAIERPFSLVPRASVGGSASVRRAVRDRACEAPQAPGLPQLASRGLGPAEPPARPRRLD